MTGLFLKEGSEIYNPYLYYAMVMLLNFEIRKLLQLLENANAQILYVKTDGIICNNIDIDVVNSILGEHFCFYEFNIIKDCRYIALNKQSYLLLTNNLSEIKGVKQSDLTTEEREMVSEIMLEIYKLEYINVNTVEKLLLEFFKNKDVTY